MFISYNIYAKTSKGEIIADWYTECHSVALEMARVAKKSFEDCQIIMVEHKAVKFEENTITF